MKEWQDCKFKMKTSTTKTPPDLLPSLALYARLLDSQFRIPFTPITFGLDGLLGLIPGVGDAAAFLLSLYPVHMAWRYGAGSRVILKMLLNLLLDLVLGSVPILGDLFDIGFKANLRNVALLRQHIETATDDANAPKPR